MPHYYSLSKQIFRFICCFLILIIAQSCATYKVQTGKNIKEPVATIKIASNEVDHTFYLISNTGNINESTFKNTLQPLQLELNEANSNSTLLYLGNSIKNKENKKDTISKFSPTQFQITKNFKGKTIVIPGSNEWQNGLQGLQAEENFVTTFFKDSTSFSPKGTCPLESVAINKNITLITINSQWYIEDWDKHPGINDTCSIKNRKDFFKELEKILYDNKDKTVLVAMHHPLLTNGNYGGQFSAKNMLLTSNRSVSVPLAGSFYNIFRKTSGVNSQDVLNQEYAQLSERVKTLIQNNNNVIVVSGHEQNLEYIEHDNIKQVISGAADETTPARAIYPNDFSYGKNGFGKLEVLKSGSVILTFLGFVDGEEIIKYKQEILKPIVPIKVNFPTNFPTTKETTVYDVKDTKKTLFYNFLWGKHYRNYYGTTIKAKVATLDNLYGGLKVDQEVTSQQSNALRALDKYNNEYELRAIKKNATRFFQSTVFVNQFVEEDLKDTYLETFLMDFYTTSHPFTPFIVDDLSKSINLYHTNPKLYYIPKHNALGQFNANFGDELYLVEEIPSESQKDKSFFGKPNTIESTENLYKNLTTNDSFKIDERAYIRSRLFDMLVGDWNRNADQWNWSEFKKGNETIYKPIPRNRDQAFPNYGGYLMSLILYIPEFRKMQTYREDIANLKWLNSVGYEMDMALLQENKEENWLEEAKFIQKYLTDDVIDKAFQNLPDEVIDATSKQLKSDLKSRRDKLINYAKEYYKVLQKRVTIVGTDNKEHFIIKKNKKNEIAITQIRFNKEGIEESQFTRTFDAKKTKEIWIYGLNSEDIFQVEGTYRSKIKIRLIGGQSKDSYLVENGNNIKIYDFKSKENVFAIDGKTSKRLSDDYEMNLYDTKKSKYHIRAIVPNGGFNPDDGIKLGFVFKYTHNGFRQNPYSSKHKIAPNYYFATNGFEVTYSGHFPKLLGKLDFNIDSKVTSPNFAINYFGFGNETVYLDKEKETNLDFNRVKMSSFYINPSISRIGRLGSTTRFQLGFENIKVEQTTGRFVATSAQIQDRLFTDQQFASTKLSYGYENYDVISLPTLGMGFMMSGEWKTNLNYANKNFFTLESKLNISHKITKNGKMVFETLIRGKYITNDNYDFYHGASIGGNNGLRGFRNERFLGRSSFYQTSDIRFTIGTIKRSLLPMKYGVIGGFDYGRVWLKDDTSKRWNTSYGGSIWLNGLNIVTAKLGYFASPIDKGRVTAAVQFGF